MKLSHLFSLSFIGAVFIGLAVTTCAPSTPIYEESTYALERLHKGHAYVIDSALTWRDCADYLRHYPESYRCAVEPARLR